MVCQRFQSKFLGSTVRSALNMGQRIEIFAAVFGVCIAAARSTAAPSRMDFQQSFRVSWNTTFPHDGCDAPISVTFGWAHIYVSLNTGVVSFLNNSTGKIMSSAVVPSQSCSIWSNSFPLVEPLEQNNSAVVVGGNVAIAFRGTSFDHDNVLWRSPEFVCTNLIAVSSQAVVVTNFTDYGVINAKNGSMWTLTYTTYENSSDCDANMYLIDPLKSTASMAFYTYWPSFSAGKTIYAMYNAVTGGILHCRCLVLRNLFNFTSG